MVAHVSFAHVETKTRRKGWFLKELTLLEGVMWGRWPYWLSVLMNGTIGELPEFAIPRIDFGHLDTGGDPPAALVQKLSVNGHGKQMLDEIGTAADTKRTVLDIVGRVLQLGAHLKGIFDWWLWAFGSYGLAERPAIPEKAQVILYTEMNLGRLIAHPGDWGALICNEFVSRKRHSAWFPTPQSVVRLISEITFDKGEQRTVSVHDPCVGTGAFLLGASNHSLVLSGQDIDPLMCAACEFAGFLFMPWLVRSGINTVAELQRPDPAVVPCGQSESVPSTLFDL